mgnify:CR=1 FL=1
MNFSLGRSPSERQASKQRDSRPAAFCAAHFSLPWLVHDPLLPWKAWNRVRVSRRRLCWTKGGLLLAFDRIILKSEVIQFFANKEENGISSNSEFQPAGVDKSASAKENRNGQVWLHRLASRNSRRLICKPGTISDSSMIQRFNFAAS